MDNQRIFSLIGAFNDPGQRARSAKHLAEMLSAEDIILFSKDPILQILLPAPGFPQTLPDGVSWKKFVKSCERHDYQYAELISPYTQHQVRASAIQAEDGSVLVLLGKNSDLLLTSQIIPIIPLISSALLNERISTIAKGEVEVESLYAERAKVLAQALNDTRKNLEAELRKSTNILNSITDAFFALDRDWKFIEMNSQAESLIGKVRIDILGKNIWDIFPKAVGSSYYLQYSKAIETQKPVFFEEFIPTTSSWYEVRAYPSREGLAVYFNDITKKKNTERKLHSAINEKEISLEILSTINRVGKRLTAELNLETLVQQVTDAATRLTSAQFGAFFYNTIDKDGHALLLNVVSGVPKEKFSSFPNPRATEVFQPTFVGAGTVRSGNITKDPRFGKNSPYNGLPPGHLPVKSYLAVSVISRTGEVIGGLFFGHQKENVFTEQAEKIAEGLASQAAVAMDNARLYRRIQESVQARDEFLSIASHELKTPLTSLKLQSQLRIKKLGMGSFHSFDESTLKKMFETDTRQIDRLARLIDDMLDISRINTGKLALQTERVDLCLLVKDVVERHSGQINDYPSLVRVSCSQEVIGFWDRFRIEQVITNLLTNALKYGNQMPVDIMVKINDSCALLEVIDQGIGIAKENQDRIFERFERAISANEISGLGLGLFIVKQIVEMHEGSIDLISEPGKGSRFIVTLPLSMGGKNE